ncbi:MAG TPA: hypothetical protein EYH56_03160 [Nanoarchaeota archaeon]|nr:hypothetical protein [Nanoarchaeota archaeon]
MGYWSKYYSKLDKYFEKLPKINPDFISLSSVILSVVFVYININLFNSHLVNLLLLFLILVLDYLDGVFARKINKKDEHIDIACDRISELAIFSVPFLYHLLPLVIFNIILSVIKLKKNIRFPIVLPLRQGVFIIFLWFFVSNYF